MFNKNFLSTAYHWSSPVVSLTLRSELFAAIFSAYKITEVQEHNIIKFIHHFNKSPCNTMFTGA